MEAVHFLIKSVKIFSFISIVLFCFSSCEKDDEIIHSNYPLNGTYKFAGVDEFYTGMWTEGGQEVPYTDSELNEAISYAEELYSKTAEYTFYPNGNLIYKDTDEYSSAKYFLKDSIVYVQIKGSLFYNDTTFAFLRYRDEKLVGYYGAFALFKEGAPIYDYQKIYMNHITMLDTALKKLRYPSLNVLLKDDYLLVEEHRTVWKKM